MKRVSLLFACLFATCILAGEPKQQPKRAQAWTYDEAVTQLKLYPKDAYLQYVVLQLGKRENRLPEAAAELDKLLGNQMRRERNGRAEGVDLFNIFSGALAIQESLQLDTMRGKQDVRTAAVDKAAVDKMNKLADRPRVKGGARKAESRPSDPVRVTSPKPSICQGNRRFWIAGAGVRGCAIPTRRKSIMMIKPRNRQMASTCDVRM